ncbi:MAG: DMT family transporter [Microbacterium sp.]
MTISSYPVVGILLAVLSAALLTLGNALQSRGVARASGGGALGASQTWALVRQPVWLGGTALFGAAILVQLGALAFAPLIVVQPVGVVALVFASLLTAAVTKTAPRIGEVVAIAVCVVSLGVFVTVAASVSDQTTITDAQLVAVLIVLLAVLALTFAALTVWRGRGRTVPPVAYVLLGGLYSGFVATLGKTVILRIQTAFSSHDIRLDDTNLLTIACVAGIAVAGALSIWFVQTAHTVNSPQVVVAGLTVVDPFVAVILGITVLNEAANAPGWSFAVFAAAGAAAMWGVWSLARTSQDTAAPAAPGHPPTR